MTKGAKPKKGKADKGAAAGPAKSLREAGIQRYTTEEVHRRQIQGAPYNPRTIRDEEREKLKKIIERHGLVASLTWNRQSGNLVSGHQRLSIIDDAMGTDDYTLELSVVDVPMGQEKELNVALNNVNAMGSFDEVMLRDIFKDTDVSFEGAGFSHSDMIREFGEDIFENRTEELQQFTERLAEMATLYDSVTEKNQSKAYTEKYLVFVFPDGAHVDAFLKAAGMEDNRYQNGVGLMDKWGVPSPKPKD